MILRATDIMPLELVTDAKFIERHCKFVLRKVDDTSFAIDVDGEIRAGLLNAIEHSPTSIVSVMALSDWIAHGPKIFRPNRMQAEAMTHVELRIDEYSQPYRSLLIDVSDLDLFPQLKPTGILLHHVQEVNAIAFLIITREHDNDMNNIVSIGDDLERAISKFNDEVPRQVREDATSLLRMGINFCLYLMSVDTAVEPCLRKEFDSNRRLAAENSERGRRAQKRCAADLRIVRIVHARDEKCYETTGDGKSPSPHWRRGHWRMQRHGPNNSLRKRILIKATFVGQRNLLPENTVYR